MDKFVNVYYDSTRKVFSVKRDGRVTQKPRKLMLHSVSFRVSDKGRERVRKYGQKFPHAFVRGVITKPVSPPATAVVLPFWYNPFLVDGFTLGHTNKIIRQAEAVILTITKNGPECPAINPS